MVTKLEKMVIDPFGKLYYDGEWSWTNDDASDSPWVEKRRPFVCQQLKEVKTDAQTTVSVPKHCRVLSSGSMLVNQNESHSPY
ncbi:hypothetical protein GBA52_029085 [Prunus armeniaca]|nr:hypothetical protein GBA52_029085 [Prunus armeniaca]